MQWNMAVHGSKSQGIISLLLQSRVCWLQNAARLLAHSIT